MATDTKAERVALYYWRWRFQGEEYGTLQPYTEYFVVGSRGYLLAFRIYDSGEREDY